MLHKRLAYGLLATLATFANAEGESDVHQLTKDTFDDFVKANDIVLAECELMLPHLRRWQLFGLMPVPWKKGG